MKKKILSIIILALLFGGVVFAQDDNLPDPGLTPDSPFYFLERATEAVRTFFTFGDLKKAERHAFLAAERLAEAKAVAEKGKSEFIEKTLARYENQLEKALVRTEKAKEKRKDTREVVNVISEATKKHLMVLQEVLEKVPEEAKPAIERTMTVSSRGGERALEAASSGQSFEIFKTKCLESGGPSEMCESIVNDLQSNKSLRTVCVEKGGPAEMCEQLPTKRFESFKEIEDLCVGSGGPADMCSTLESKCKEFGITTPNECFLVLSISSITTFQSAELKNVPRAEQPISPSPAELEERKRIEAEIKKGTIEIQTVEPQ